MADVSAEKSPKRRVRNPETFRERAVKAAEESNKPPRKHYIRSFVGKSLGPIFLPIGKGLKKAFSVQPLKSVAWVAKLIGRILVPRYLRNSAKEVRLVTWPNWRQRRRLTFAVLAFAVVFGASVALLDYCLDKVFKQILLK